jgi:hypothetical protein
MEEYNKTTYRSLEAIQARKDYLLKDIRNDDQKIRSLWGNLFHKPDMLVSTKTPSKRINSLMTTSAGIFDGIILAWKLYKKFGKKKKKR